MPSVGNAPVFILSARRSMGKKANNAPKGPNGAFVFPKCLSPMDPIVFPTAVASPSVYILTITVHLLPVGRGKHLKCPPSAVQGFSFYQLGAVRAKKPITPPMVQLVPSTSPSDRAEWTQFFFRSLRRPLAYVY